jgi:PAS domain S-box-containing protein
MKIYEPGRDFYNFKLLPAFAKHVLDKHVDDFVSEQLRVSRVLNLPVLKHLNHLTDHQILEFGKVSAKEFLTYLINNQGGKQVALSLERWIADNLSIIGRYSVVAEDISGINYTREIALKRLLKDYPISYDDKCELSEEIDTLFFGAVTSGISAYSEILKSKIEEEAHFNAQLINTSPAIIFIFDLQKNKEIYVNGNVEEVMGYTADEVLRLEENLLSILTHPDDVPTLHDGISKIVSDTQGKTHRMEYRFKHKDGTYRWLRTYSMVFKRDADGRPVEVLGSSFEITVERETAIALSKRESQLLEAQSIAQLGSFEWNMTTNESVNTPQLIKILGFDATHQGFERFMSHVHPLDRDRVQRQVTDAFRSGSFDSQYRYVVDGSEKVLWTRGVIVFDNRKPVIMRGTVQDITQLKRIEDELIKKTKELEKSNESLQQFASIASHDLKEPLRKMSMYTDLVMTTEEKKLTEGSHLNLEKVKASSIRMQNMIDDILNFSTISRQEQKQKTDLTSVIAEVKSLLEGVIKEKSASITCDHLPEANVIPSQFRQLFQNLFSNALKFVKQNEKPAIHITHKFVDATELQSRDLQPAEVYLEITVADNGIGFKQEHAQKIFGLFARLHGRAVYEGSGLGLAICKRIVENHGGIIRAESNPGQGAAFIITIPA